MMMTCFAPMRPLMIVAIIIFASLLLTVRARLDCSRIGYDRCIRIADPLIKEAHLVFPDNLNDINLVCNTWNQFVDCLKTYTDRCFTEQQRRQFNKAVENPIESVHQMCMQPNYQEEYLYYAPCIKSTITDRNHCGTHYNLLVDQVSQGDNMSKSTLCCSHNRFKQCVEKKTKQLCDRGQSNGSASRFSSQIIDKALSFLQEQCLNYIPSSGDCTIPISNDPYNTDPLITISTSSSEVYPWSSTVIHEDDDTNNKMVPKEVVLPSRVTPPKLPTTSTQWLPSSTTLLHVNQHSSTQQQDSLPDQGGGSGRTRPASYGRSNSWSSDSSSSTMTAEMMSTTTVAPLRPNWAAATSVSPPLNRQPTEIASTWYPAAGSQLVNEVDEPNQQGLRKPQNSAATALFRSNLLITFTTTTIFISILGLIVAGGI